MTKLFAMLAILAAAATTAGAALRSQTVEYRQGDTVLEGYVAWDDSAQGKRPGVLVVHDWMGAGPFGNGKCDQLAKLGYVAFAADIYGKGVRPANDAGGRQARRASTRATAPSARARRGGARTRSARTRSSTRSGSPRSAYCFGGTTVALELARSGADLAGVVSFHGGLDTPAPADGEEHQGEGPGAARGRRPVRPRRRGRGLRGRDAQGRSRLAAGEVRRRGALLHEAGRGERQLEGRRLQRARRQAIVGRHAGGFWSREILRSDRRGAAAQVAPAPGESEREPRTRVTAT